MPYWKNLQKASFERIPFAVNAIEVQGGLRDHIHEYPHTDGGSPELLGRKVYVIHMSAVFDENIVEYPGNYPDGLGGLRSLFEASTRGTLVIPNLGTIPAYCRSWPQKWRAESLSGETAEYEFVEYRPADTLDVFSAPQASSKKIATALAQMQDFQKRWYVFDTSLFTALVSEVRALLAYRDGVDLAFLLIQQKLLSIQSMISALDRSLTSPVYTGLIEALKQLWKSCLDFGKNVQALAGVVKTFVVPSVMSAMAVSRLIFGTTDRAMDLLQMNPIQDAFKIPAGTTLRYLGSS